MKPEEALHGVTRLLLDTNPVICVLEKDAKFAERTWAVFTQARLQNVQLIISPLTLIEVLSKPGMTDDELKRFGNFCLATQGIEFIPIHFDDQFAIRIGFFRRSIGVKLPDCIQFASAERLNCEAILTADPHFNRHPTSRAILIPSIDL